MKKVSSQRRWSGRRLRNRTALALGLAIPTMLTVWLVPWGYLVMKLGVQPVVRQHTTVAKRDGRYWTLTVVDFSLMMRTSVSAEPDDDPERAAQRAENIYEILSNLTPPDTISVKGMAKSVLHRSDAVPRWARISLSDPTPFGLPWKPGSYTYTASETAVGWPLRALRGERIYASTVTPFEDGRPGGMTQNRHTARGFVELPALGPAPFLPIWRGLLLDLLVFTLPWYLLLWGANAVRRRRRSRRGRCTECNYDTAGLDRGTPCPECGACRT